MESDVAEPVLKLDPAVLIVATESGVRVVGRGTRHALNGRIAQETHASVRSGLEEGVSRRALLEAFPPDRRPDVDSYLQGLEAAGAFTSEPTASVDVVGFRPLDAATAHSYELDGCEVQRAVFREHTGSAVAAPAVWFVAEPAHKRALLALDDVCTGGRVVVLTSSFSRGDEALRVRLACALATVGYRTGGALYRLDQESGTMKRLFEAKARAAAFQLGLCAPSTRAQIPLASFEAGHPLLGTKLIRSALTPVLAERAAIAALIGPLAFARESDQHVCYGLTDSRAQLRAAERALLDRVAETAVPMEQVDLLGDAEASRATSTAGLTPGAHLADCLRGRLGTLPAWKGTGPGGLTIVRWAGTLFGSMSSATAHVRALAYASAASFSLPPSSTDEVTVDIEDVEGADVACRHLARAVAALGPKPLHTAQAKLWGVAVHAAWVAGPTPTSSG